MMGPLRHGLDLAGGGKKVLVPAGEGRYCNRRCYRAPRDRTESISRTRNDAGLCRGAEGGRRGGKLTGPAAWTWSLCQHHGNTPRSQRRCLTKCRNSRAGLRLAGKLKRAAPWLSINSRVRRQERWPARRRAAHRRHRGPRAPAAEPAAVCAATSPAGPP